MQKKSRLKKTVFLSIAALAILFTLFLLFDFLFPLDLQRVSKPASQIFYDRNKKVLRYKLSSDGYWRFPATSGEIPPLLQKSVVAFEDKYFYYHFGINPFSIVRAIYHNATRQRVIGASTLTMQVARMMYHRPRTLASKLTEMFNALQLEYHFTKKEILTYYFNLAPYGGNIEGVKSAALFYFHKPLHELTISQIALLTSIPKNPNANRPTHRKHLNIYRDKIIQKLYTQNVINKDQTIRALHENITARRIPAPFHAPHFTDQIQSDQSKIYTTLDLNLQRFTLNRLRSQIEKLKNAHLHNAAALILDNKTMHILAYVGSANFFDAAAQGQNNGITMIRSPGSTLKPFIYARALDKGFITPNQELFDTGLYLQGYTPQNFHKKFTGKISAKEALQNSLNIPAIALNHILKDASLYELLKSAEITSIDHPKAYYGDALALGGFGISLMDLTLLYTALANGGVKKEPIFLMKNKSAKEIRLFSKEAAWLVSDILSDVTRTRLGGYWDATRDIPKISFKTGTSASSKDLLTVGYTPEYTVSVWFGNFSGQKTKNLTGLRAASEVVLDIFEHLNAQHKLSWFQKPNTIRKQKRCVDAIRRQTCRNYTDDFLIQGITPALPCDIIRPETIAQLITSGEITSLEDLRTNRCYTHWKQYNPVITTPANHATITLNPLLPKFLKKIKLNCYTFDKNQTIQWFIDTQKPIYAKSGQPLYRYLTPGLHEIGCLNKEAKLTLHEVVLKEE